MVNIIHRWNELLALQVLVREGWWPLERGLLPSWLRQQVAQDCCCLGGVWGIWGAPFTLLTLWISAPPGWDISEKIICESFFVVDLFWLQKTLLYCIYTRGTCQSQREHVKRKRMSYLSKVFLRLSPPQPYPHWRTPVQKWITEVWPMWCIQTDWDHLNLSLLPWCRFCKYLWPFGNTGLPTVNLGKC